MIEFTCPGCRSQCVANEAFRGMRARCLVCGAFIRIPAESGEVAFPLGPIPAGPLPTSPRSTASKPSLPPKPSVARAGRYEPADEPAVDPDLLGFGMDGDERGEGDENAEQDAVFSLVDPIAEGPAPRGKKEPAKPKSKRPPKKTAEGEGNPGNWAGLADDADTLDETPPGESTESGEGEGKAKRTAKEKRKRMLVIVGASVLASVVIACVIVFTGGNDPPKPVVAAQQPPEEPLPPPLPPKKKVEPPPPPQPPPPEIERAPAPRVSGDPIRVVAVQLLADRKAKPEAFDAEYRGKLFVVRGTYARTANGILYLAEGTDDTGGIACVPPRLAPKGPIEPPPEASALQPGQAVLVRGWYASDLRLTDCRVVATAGPADEEYRDKTIELVGIVESALAVDPDGGEQFPTIVLEPPTTDCPVSVRCLFRATEREKLTTIRPGQTVTIRGRCEGRSFRVVRMHNCALVANDDAPLPNVPRVRAERFFATYEVDLLPFERPNPAVPPVAVTAEQLAAAFGTSTREATETYGYKGVTLTGKVLERRPTSRMIIFETATNQKYQVSAVFTPAQYARVKNFPDLTIRGVCVGLSGKYVRIENAESIDPQAGDSTVRTTAEFLPLTPNKDLIYDVLVPAGSQNNPITRYAVRPLEGETVRTTALRSGTFSKATLFADTPGVAKWTRDLSKQKGSVLTAEFRLREGTIELRDRPDPPAQPSSWWDPMFKIGLRKGESWSSTMPDGRTVTYTVANFGKDSTKRNTVDILRVVKSAKDGATNWEESTLTYARGIGEVRRVTTRHSNTGKAFTTMELKLVEGGPEPKIEPDPKDKGDKKDGKKDEK